jgi:hypothetical protein
MNLEKVTVISLDEFENEALKEVKKNRTKAEYCWTCTSSIIYNSIIKYNLPSCTYIDSDLYFFSDPAVLISELAVNNKRVLITEHRFTPLAKLYSLKRAGRFCVQFMTFSNEEDSMQLLKKWMMQCIDWCYARYEDGKFGDQKYLEDWPAKYDCVHILNHQGGGLAPWNINRYKFRNNNERIAVINRNTSESSDAIFYHFQYVKFVSPGIFDIGWYNIPHQVKKIFYIPYLTRLIIIEKNLSEDNHEYSTNFPKLSLKGIKKFMKETIYYNILKIS